jgi:hypothetical protein
VVFATINPSFGDFVGGTRNDDEKTMLAPGVVP